MSDTVNTQPQADFINVLSSEMISNIVEDYFNRELYKVPVKVVDTKPTESGYAFGICFAAVAPNEPHKAFSDTETVYDPPIHTTHSKRAMKATK